MSKRSQEQQESLLYDQARMQRRFAYFESICLPSLAAQTDMDFTLVVMIGETMPIRFRRRLKGLMQTYPFLRLATLEPAGPLNSTRRAFRRGWDETSEFVTGFRIDDDDAVASDYIARTRETAETLLRIGWADTETPAVIAYHRGLYWDMNDQEHPFYDFTDAQPLGLASAMVTRADAQENIFRWNHRKLPAYVRCWTDPTERMFVRTLHGHNDSDRSVPNGAEPVSIDKARNLLRHRFGIDPPRALGVMRRLVWGVGAPEDGEEPAEE